MTKVKEIIEQPARQALREAEERLEVLRDMIDDTDEALKSCSTTEAPQLLHDRRVFIDELNWLEPRLPGLRKAAEVETFEEMRVDLNRRWQPLVARRKQATQEFQRFRRKYECLDDSR